MCVKRYKRLHGESGVVAFESGKNFIRVKFTDGEVYTYTHKSAGKDAIDAMKKLADEGRGLSSYISRFVKDKFYSKE